MTSDTFNRLYGMALELAKLIRDEAEMERIDSENNAQIMHNVAKIVLNAVDVFAYQED